MALNLYATRWVDKNTGHCIEIAELRDDGSHVFAVRDQFGACLNKQGEWEYEFMPSERSSDFYTRCRFDDFEGAAHALEKVL